MEASNEEIFSPLWCIYDGCHQSTHENIDINSGDDEDDSDPDGVAIVKADTMQSPQGCVNHHIDDSETGCFTQNLKASVAI